MSAKQWIITVEDDHQDGIDQVVAELESAGLVVDRVLRSLGQITGHTEDAGAEDEVDAAMAPEAQVFSSVIGVASADGAQRHSIAPPDAEVQ